MLRFWGSNRKRFRPFAARCVRGVVLLALLLAFAAPGWARGGDGIPYQEGSWDDTTKTVKYTTQTADATAVTSNTDPNVVWGEANGETWYYVPAGQPVTIEGRI